MKKKMFALLTVLCAVSVFTACSDDDDIREEFIELEGVYGSGGKDEAGLLTLDYSTTPFEGKSASFRPTGKDYATITLNRVIPGEEATNIGVKLEEIYRMSGKYSFNGTDEAKNGRTIEYQGTIEKGNMILKLDVTMPENDVMGIWELNAEEPVSLIWELSDEELNECVEKVLPTVVEILSADLKNVLQSVTLGEDGDIRAMYSEADLSTPNFQLSPANFAHYYVKESKLYVLLNVEMIKDAESRSTQESVIVRLLTEGIPVNYALKDENLKLFVNGTTLLTLLDDSAVKAKIAEVIADIEDEEMQEKVEKIIALFKRAVEATTTFELALNMTAAE